MYLQSDIISARREEVYQSYNSAKATNHRLYLEGSNKATSEYIYSNQKMDANNIVDMYYKHNLRVVSIQKKTKVGADGLMIEVAKLMSTHIDDKFVVNPSDIRIITGMSNVSWEKDMIDKSPSCFKSIIFHHGKLSKSSLIGSNNSFNIIDEVDTGDKEHQLLHNTLKEAGLLDVKHMIEHNNRFLFISATMFKELHDLYQWGDLHSLYKMTIPESYIGHCDFLERNIIREFYPLTTVENIKKWIQEDIIDYYGNDCRVHLVRVTNKTINMIHNECIRKGLDYKNHTSSDRLTYEDEQEIFIRPLSKHVVIAIKGLFRRANLIPNVYKLRIGATHELYTKKVDNNVQIQGFPGRMTGYWRNIIESGHKTGPYRTSMQAIKEYEQNYIDPFGITSYQSAGFKKKDGKVTTLEPTMLSPKNISNMDARSLPVDKRSNPIHKIDNITEEEISKFNKDEILDIINKYNTEAYEEYKSYNVHCWKIDTESKREKYGLSAMLKEGAVSSVTNITDKKKNVLMVYLYEKQLIISAWSGAKE